MTSDPKPSAHGIAALDSAQTIASWRRQFPILAHKTYLNSGSYGALALQVRAALESYLSIRDREGATWDAWIGRQESLRALLGTLLNASVDEIAVTTSASAGLNSLASALTFCGSRRRIVVSDFEFPTNAQIWHAQEPRGAEVVHVAPDSDGLIPAERFVEHIDERTRLVAISHVCYRNGAKLDIAAIARLAHAHGAWLLVDGYQTVGAQHLDVREIDADFLVGGTLKYLLGTAGVGFLYARRGLLESLLPTASGWFAQEDISAMDITANRPAHSARRFESGTPPVPGLYASEAGLRIVLDIGTRVIERRVNELVARGIAQLQAAGCRLATPVAEHLRGPTIAIRAADDRALVAELGRRNIVTSCRDGNVRASFHYYNDETDIERFVGALETLRGLLA